MATQEELLRENTRALKELTKLLEEQVREESAKGNERKEQTFLLKCGII